MRVAQRWSHSDFAHGGGILGAEVAREAGSVSWGVARKAFPANRDLIPVRVARERVPVTTGYPTMLPATAGCSCAGAEGSPPAVPTLRSRQGFG